MYLGTPEYWKILRLYLIIVDGNKNIIANTKAI